MWLHAFGTGNQGQPGPQAAGKRERPGRPAGREWHPPAAHGRERCPTGRAARNAIPTRQHGQKQMPPWIRTHTEREEGRALARRGAQMHGSPRAGRRRAARRPQRGKLHGGPRAKGAAAGFQDMAGYLGASAASPGLVRGDREQAPQRDHQGRRAKGQSLPHGSAQHRQQCEQAKCLCRTREARISSSWRGKRRTNEPGASWRAAQRGD